METPKNEIAIFSQLPTYEQDRIAEFLLKDYDVVIKVGNWLVHKDDGLLGQIVNIYSFTDIRRVKKDNDWADEEFENFMLEHTDERWRRDENVKHKASEFFGGNNSRVYVYAGDLSELKQEAMALVMSGKIPQRPEVKHEQGLLNFDKATFTGMKRELVLQSNEINSKVAMARAMVTQKLSQLTKYTEGLLKEVKRLTNIIWTIELYLGIKEDIVHLQSGTPASDDEPIRLLQERLYMDEEIGDPSDGGMDIRKINDFVDWMFKISPYFGYAHYKLLVPYEKCVRIMRVRRHEKNYGCPWINLQMHDANFETYILIRNGENIYSISTDMVFGPKLFPAQDEIIQLIQDTEDHYKNVTYSNVAPEDKINNTIDTYKRNLIIIQGLIDRTEVFGHLFGKVNLMSGAALEKGQIEFIYDADYSTNISDGQTSFLDRMKTGVGHGDRALVRMEWSDRDRTYRAFPKLSYRRGEYSYPASPHSGLYKIQTDKDENYPYFMYLPSDEVYTKDSYDSQPRKLRVAYSLSVVSDHNILNFDEFSHRDIQYLWDMQHNRRLRKNYMRYMEILTMLIKYKREEMEQEAPFVLLVQGQTGCTELEVLDALHWWKTKNTHKRALTVDDSKALRMIIKKIKEDKL